MIKRKFRDYHQVYSGGQFITGYYRNNTLTIDGQKLKVGDVIVFIIGDTLFEGEITNFEKPLFEEEYSEIDMLEVDGEEYSLIDMIWLGIA